MNKPKNGVANRKKNGGLSRGIIAAAGIVLAVVAGFVVLNNIPGKRGEPVVSGGDLKINKSELSRTAKFYPYETDGTYMEVIALKADDGSIRTAFNTCQVCFKSGRGYYSQQGSELVCKNCGNRFKLDQVEKIRGGCNPVPISKEDKTEDDQNIVISEQYLTENKSLFSKWKKQ